MRGDFGHVLFMTDSVVYGVLFPKSTLLYSWVLFPTFGEGAVPFRGAFPQSTILGCFTLRAFLTGCFSLFVARRLYG